MKCPSFICRHYYIFLYCRYLKPANFLTKFEANKIRHWLKYFYVFYNYATRKGIVQFVQKFSVSEQFPVPVSNLVLFIAYLVSQSYKPSTISSYVSAIGYVHKLKAIPDPTSSFLILKLLRACHKQQKSVDSRMPIVKPMLEHLMLTLVHTGTDQR